MGEESDRELVARFLARLEHHSVREAADLSRVHYSTVQAWRAGKWSRLDPRTRRKLLAFLQEESRGRKVVRSPEAPQEVMESADDGGAPPGSEEDRVGSLFENIDSAARFLAGRIQAADPEETKLRQIDGWEGLARTMRAIDGLPPWMWQLRRMIEDGELVGGGLVPARTPEQIARDLERRKGRAG